MNTTTARRIRHHCIVYADSLIAARWLDRKWIRLLREPDDLLVAGPALPHVRCCLTRRTLLSLRRHARWGAGQTRQIARLVQLRDARLGEDVVGTMLVVEDH